MSKIPNSIIELMHLTSKAARSKHNPPPQPDIYDPNIKYYFAVSGHNKGGFTECATCGKPPTTVVSISNEPVFLFKNSLSAKEYRISGMCQACQNSVFFGE